MDTTINYNNPNANFFSPGQGGNPYPIKNTGTSISPSVIGTQPLNIAPTTITPIPNVANLTSSTAITPVPSTPVTPIAPTATPATWTDKLTTLFGQTKNKEADLSTAVDTAISPYTQQLNELETQIKMQQANAISNAEAATNRVGGTTTSNSIATQQQQRTDSIEALKLSALAEGMRGNIALAESHATKAIEAKYAQINSDIETAKTNIYNNYDSFSTSEKKKADQALLRLDEKDAFAKANIENEKASAAVIQTAIKQSAENGNPVPSIILSQANKLTDPTEVTALLAPYLKDAAQIQKDIDAHKVAMSTINKNNSSSTVASGGLIDAVIANPELFNQLTPTQKGTIAPKLAKRGFDAFGKPLTDTAIKEINQTNTAVDSLKMLRQKILDNKDMIGPIKGIAALNPYSKARTVQADIDRVKQQVGKALEGGVLRKEDEEKYKKILATITDTPETAIYKIDELLTSIQSSLGDYKALQGSSGKNVPSSPSSQMTKSGKAFDVQGAKAKGYTQKEIDDYLNTH